MTTTKDTERAERQARAQLDSIVAMVKRLEHCQECDGEDCELSKQEIIEGLGYIYEPSRFDHEMESYREQYHNEDNARQNIAEDPLSVEVHSDWHTPGSEDNKPTDFNILLCTGGPACRIIGELNSYAQPARARIEYQDWFTPWIELVNITREERAALLTYAQQFYYEEC